MNASAIELVQLTKHYHGRQRRNGSWTSRLRDFVSPQFETVTAVDGVSFRIDPGERVAFIGPNGAGKSTTLKILAGILHPDSGDARVLGCVPWRDQKRLAFQVGTVFGQRSQLWYHLPARDTFELLAKVYELDPERQRRRTTILVDVFGLGGLLDKPVSQLSLGERMRAELVASLIHSPRVLFLDEPTIGLDVAAKAAIRELLRERSEQDGATLLLTSHDTGDMECVCERVIVINCGHVLWDGSLRELRTSVLDKKRISIWSERESLHFDLPGLSVLSREPHRVQVELRVGTTPVGAVVESALRQGGIRDLTVEDPPLDDVVRAFYGAFDSGESS